MVTCYYRRDYILLNLTEINNKLVISLSVCFSLPRSLSHTRALTPSHLKFNVYMASDILDTGLDAVAQGYTKLPPDKVPWNVFELYSHNAYMIDGLL